MGQVRGNKIDNSINFKNFLLPQLCCVGGYDEVAGRKRALSKRPGWGNEQELEDGQQLLLFPKGQDNKGWRNVPTRTHKIRTAYKCQTFYCVHSI